jgi:flagellar biosynthetic protein FliR
MEATRQLLAYALPHLVPFALVMGRVGGFLWSAPLWAGRAMPPLVRVVTSALLSLAVYPFAPAAPSGDSAAAFALALAAEIALGLALGWAAHVVFSAFRLAGHLLEIKMGLGFSALVDPQGAEPAAVLSAFFEMLATLVFFAVDGPAFLLRALAESYALFPAAAGGDLFRDLAAAAGGIFAIGLQVSAPVLVGLLLSDLVLGIVNRALPEMNVFLVALPLQFLLGVLLLLLSLPALVWFAAERWGELGSLSPR